MTWWARLLRTIMVCLSGVVLAARQVVGSALAVPSILRRTALVLAVGLSALSVSSGLVDLFGDGLSLNQLLAERRVLEPKVIAAIVAASVAAFLMYSSFRAFLSERGAVRRVVALGFYLFFLAWSLAFGFGFYWSNLVAREATLDGAASAFTAARASLTVTLQTAKAFEGRIGGLIAESDRRRQAEESGRGNTCGDSSPGAEGFRSRYRTQVTDDLEGTATQFALKAREVAGAIMPAMNAIDGYFGGPPGSTPDARADAIDRANRGVELAVAQYNGLLPSIRSVVAGLNNHVDELKVPTNAAGFLCFDPYLAQQIEEVVREGDTIAGRPLTITSAVAREGSNATRDAVLRLWENVAYLVTLPFPVKISAPADPIGPEDSLALFASVLVEASIVFLAIFEVPLRARDLSSWEDRTGPRNRIARRFAAITRQQPKVLLGLIDRYVATHRGHHYLVVPRGLMEDPIGEYVLSNIAVPLLAANEVEDIRMIGFVPRLLLSFSPSFRRSIGITLHRAGARIPDSRALREADAAIYRFRSHGSLETLILALAPEETQGDIEHPAPGMAASQGMPLRQRVTTSFAKMFERARSLRKPAAPSVGTSAGGRTRWNKLWRREAPETDSSGAGQPDANAFEPDQSEGDRSFDALGDGQESASLGAFQARIPESDTLDASDAGTPRTSATRNKAPRPNDPASPSFSESAPD